MSTSLPQSGGTTASFGNAPQAGTDSFSYIEDYLMANGLLYNQATDTLTLDVMANDLGGKAKSLFSIDDGFGNQLSELATRDLLANQSFSTWQLTANGNSIRIANGKIEYRLSDGLGGVRDVNSMNAGEVLTDSFTYAIKLGNGTLSWARVTISLTGNNDAATITGTSTGNVVEAGGDDNALPGTPSASGTLAVSDVDSGQATFAAPPLASLAGTYGNFTFSPSTGQWTYTLDNARPATQGLAQGESAVETLTVTSLDGTATRAITVTVKGTNDGPEITSGAQSGTVVEDTALSASGQVTASDVDNGAVLSYTGNATGSYGSFAVTAATGAWTYTLANAAHQALAEGEEHTETFTVTVTDEHGAQAAQDVTITVTGTNDAPVASATTAALDEDAGTFGTLSASDVDHDAALAFAIDGAAPAGFTLISTATGAWSFDASSYDSLKAGETLPLTVNFTVTDEHGAASSSTLTITVTGTNDAPVASATLASLDEDTTTSGTLAASDVDHDAALAFAIDGAAPAGFTLISTATGAWSFDASSYDSLKAGETLPLTVNFTVTDEHGAASSSTLTITVTGTNDAPVTSDDSATTDEDTAVLGTVADNTTDPDDTPTFSVVGTAPAGLTFNPDGTWSFDPAGNFDALDTNDSTTVSFDYKANDGEVDSNTSTVTITVTGVNDAPVIDVNASELSGSVTEDTLGADVATGQIAASDVDDNAVLEYTVVGSSTYGTFSVDANGVWTYELDNSRTATQALAAGASPTETFTVAVKDEHGFISFEDVDVTITVNGTNDPAVITGNTSGSANEAGGVNNGTAGSNATGDLNSTDVDNTNDAWNAVASPIATVSGYGSYTIDASGNWNYAVNQNNNAVQALNVGGGTLSDTFTVTTVDGTTQTINVTITGANDAAVVSGTTSGSVTEAGGTNNSIPGTPTASGTLTDSDVDNAPNSFTAVAPGAASANGYGTFAMTAGGVWTYTLNNANAAVNALSTGQTLSDSFTVTTVDGTPQMVTVTINGTSDNNPPIVTNDTIWVSNSTTVTLPPAALLGNDVDVDGISLSLTNIVVASGTLAGPVTINADGSFTFTTGATVGTVGAPTVVTLTYTTSDGAGGTSTGTVTLNIVSTGAGADAVNLTSVTAYQASYIDGGAQSDTLTDGAAISTLLGGAGVDQLNGNAGNDLLIGGANNDTLSGGAGNDILRGGTGNGDAMDGGAGTEDLLDFSDGSVALNLTLVQSSSSTTLANDTGGLGNQDAYQNIEGIIGTSLNDNITGSASNDILRGGGGNDTLNGAGGTDLIDFTDGTSGINFTLVQGAGATVNLAAAGLGSDTYSNFEGVIGTAFADTLTGSANAEELRGGRGNDTISGLGGNDRIIGGEGADTLTGGLGNDTFVFSSALNNVDTITDFNANATDKIELDDATFSTLIAGALSGANFAANPGGNAVDGDDRVLFDTATGSLYYDADGSGAGAKVLFAQLDLGGLGGGTAALDATDFLIG